jgi:succinate dehydrogenase / fumarate reductase membrane anchor subunit
MDYYIKFGRLDMSLYTPIKVAKGTGAAGNGTSLFIKQRVTAIFMIPLVLWLVTFVIALLLTPMQGLPWFLSSPFSVFGAILFIMNFMYHATLGLQMIIEDYISCKALRAGALIVMWGFNGLTTVAGLVSIFTIYMLSRIV